MITYKIQYYLLHANGGYGVEVRGVLLRTAIFSKAKLYDDFDAASYARQNKCNNGENYHIMGLHTTRKHTKVG